MGMAYGIFTGVRKHRGGGTGGIRSIYYHTLYAGGNPRWPSASKDDGAGSQREGRMRDRETGVHRGPEQDSGRDKGFADRDGGHQGESAPPVTYGLLGVLRILVTGKPPEQEEHSCAALSETRKTVTSSRERLDQETRLLNETCRDVVDSVRANRLPDG